MRATSLARRRGLRPPLRLPRLGLLLRREPRLWWLAVAVTALGAGATVARVVGDADRARAAWGDTRTVAVVQRGLVAGAELGPGDVALIERPAATVPDGALHELPQGAVLRADVVAGEVLVAARVAPDGVTGVAALVPPGARAVAIPTESGSAPPLRVGDRVDVLVALAPETSGGGPPGFALATGALVVDVDDAAVTVAVPRDTAPRVAVALAQGAVTLALAGA